jgi:hypothetical protein
MKRFSLYFAALLLAIGVSGCVPKHAPTSQPGYFGPTLSLPELVTQINANNAQLSTLVASTAYEAEIHDANTGEVTNVFDTLGTIQYRAPGEFRMRLNKTAAGNVLDLGMNKDRFWLVAPEGPKTMWWGHVGAKLDPKSEIPIRPEDLLQVLAIGTMNTDLLALPAPVLRFNNDQDRYMLVWVDRADGRYLAQREVWYDRKTLEPVLVLLFDGNGRVMLRAYLSDHRPVDGTEAGPVTARRYDMFFPQSKSHLVLDMRREKVLLTKGTAPNDNSFRFPPKDIVPKDKNVDAEPSK